MLGLEPLGELDMAPPCHIYKQIIRPNWKQREIYERVWCHGRLPKIWWKKVLFRVLEKNICVLEGGAFYSWIYAKEYEVSFPTTKRTLSFSPSSFLFKPKLGRKVLIWGSWLIDGLHDCCKCVVSNLLLMPLREWKCEVGLFFKFIYIGADSKSL